GPRVLFLDEPFEAVDPVSARSIRAVLERHIESGATVVFSSHVMELVERLCDRVAIMHQGRLVAQGPTGEVKAGSSLEDAFVPLLGMGSDETLDPSRLALLPLEPPALMRGLLSASLVGLGPIATLLALSGVLARTRPGAAGTLLIALLVVVELLLCVVGSRA